MSSTVFFDEGSGLLRVLVVAPLAYGWLVLVLRVTGKRTLAQLDAFDFVVTVALGSTLATVVLSTSVALTEGALALATLALLQLVVAWAQQRSARVRGALVASPTLLLRDGEILHDVLARQRISEQHVRQVVRGAGAGGLEQVAAVVLETNGRFSVVRHDALGSGTALVDVEAPPG